MGTVQAKSKPAARRYSSPIHSPDRVGGSGREFNASAIVTAKPAAQMPLGVLYSAGPALSLSTIGRGAASGNGSGGTGSNTGVPTGGGASPGVQFKLTTDQPTAEAEEKPAEQTDALQLCACEEEGTGIVEPPRVQQQAEEEEPKEDTTSLQLVQLWDCSEYTEPTCVQTQEAASEEQVQSKCAACEAEEGVQRKCAACEAEEQVQSKCAACEAEEQVQQAGVQTRTPQMIQREARLGLKGASLPLPHGERIQAAFGRHDVSEVRTSVGGDARTANRRMGALAFTSGDRIGFRDSPSLHLVAHEAAHVVQQREGLSLPGNVGHAGDRWERHADRVADEVVEGHSAEGLLDEVAAPATPSSEHTESGANGTPTAPATAIQQQITSGASRLYESPPAAAEAPASTAEGAGEREEAGREGAGAEQNGGGEEGSALEAAEEGDSEAPPEGITADGSAPGGASTPAPAAGASA
ncbi:MAG: DUF4157 domain-containing protein, partial [Chloroflexia bacterium]